MAEPTVYGMDADERQRITQTIRAVSYYDRRETGVEEVLITLTAQELDWLGRGFAPLMEKIETLAEVAGLIGVRMGVADVDAAHRLFYRLAVAAKAVDPQAPDPVETLKDPGTTEDPKATETYVGEEGETLEVPIDRG